MALSVMTCTVGLAPNFFWKLSSVMAWCVFSGIVFLSSADHQSISYHFALSALFPWDIPSQRSFSSACPACFSLSISSDRIQLACLYPRHCDLLVQSMPLRISSAGVPLQPLPGLTFLAARFTSAARSHHSLEPRASAWHFSCCLFVHLSPLLHSFQLSCDCYGCRLSSFSTLSCPAVMV